MQKQEQEQAQQTFDAGTSTNTGGAYEGWPTFVKGEYSPAEEDTFIAAHQELGNAWSGIAKRLPGRSYSNVSNHWNSAVSDLPL